MLLPRTISLTVTLALVVAVPVCAGARNESAGEAGEAGPEETFFGQSPPGERAELLAPEALVHEAHDSPVIPPDEAWLLFQGMEVDIVFYGMVDGDLAVIENPLDIDFPEVCNGVAMSPSGDRLYIEEWKEGRNYLYYVDREGEGWTPPTYFDLGVASRLWQISIAANGSLYFASDRIMVSSWRDGSHREAMPLKLEDGTDMPGGSPFIAPDESYLIYSIEDDLHISYRRGDGTWTAPIDLGPSINSDQIELCPQITSGGEYLIFISRRNLPLFAVFWADAGFVDRLRPDDLE